jgi:hypothetical protein
MGSDALRGREAETRLFPHPAASPGHRRARRGNLRARSRHPRHKLMELLTTELDATTIVSVGHRPELEAFHSPQNRARAAPRQKLRRRALKIRLKPWRRISALGQSVGNSI